MLCVNGAFALLVFNVYIFVCKGVVCALRNITTKRSYKCKSLTLLCTHARTGRWDQRQELLSETETALLTHMELHSTFIAVYSVEQTTPSIQVLPLTDDPLNGNISSFFL